MEASIVCCRIFLGSSNSVAVCVVKDCLCWVSNFKILSVSLVISLSLSLFHWAPILIRSTLIEHLWASHIIRGSILGVTLCSKNYFKCDIIFISNTWSVSSEEFKRQVGALAGGGIKSNISEMGA